MHIYYSAQNGSESRFRDKCFFFFFSVDLCYILWSVLLHHLICIAPLLEKHWRSSIASFDLYCAIVGVNCAIVGD